MDLKQVARDTAKTLISYLTYQAVRTVLAQLSKTNPPLAFWLHGFSQLTKFRMDTFKISSKRNRMWLCGS